MYLSFYRLNVKPFQMSTDPDFLWLGEKHKEALSTMKYAILENKGVLALTGDVGTGKTTLINALIQSLGKDTIAATIYDPSLDVLEFFNMIAAAFKMEKIFENKGRFILQFRQFLKKARERKQKVLLIIDEAQAANADLLEELRMLSNLEQEHIRLLNIFFVGQNEFIDVLQQYSNRALKQRITMRYHIDPLTLSETEAYIKHRLRVSGAESPIFTTGAIAEIYAFSDGYPRLINVICDHALLSGYVREVELISADVIRECREELEVVRKEGERGSEPRGYGPRSLLPETEAVEPDMGRHVRDAGSQPREDHLGAHGAETSARLASDYMRIPERGPEFLDDEPGFAGPHVPVMATAEKPKPRRRGVFPAFIGILFIFVIGIGFGYKYFVSNDLKISFSEFMSQKPEEKRHAVKAEPEEHRGPIVSSGKETTDVPGSIEAGNVGESRYFIARSPEPTLYKEVSPKETGPSLSGKIKPQDAPPMHALPGDAEQRRSRTIAVPASKKPPQQIQPPVKKTFTPPVKTKPLKATKPEAARHVEPSGINKPRPKQDKVSKDRYWKTTIAEKPPVEKGSKDVFSIADEKKKLSGKKTGISAVAPMQATVSEPSTALKTVPEETAAEPIKIPEEKKIPALPSSRVATSGSDAERPFSQVDLKPRLDAFLKTYCRTYEKKDLNNFSTFFASDAVETGKLFRSLLPQYRRNFKRIDAMTYRIDVQRYAVQEGTGLVRIEGIFYVRARLNGKSKWRENKGDISMILVQSGNSFKVKQLDY